MKKELSKIAQDLDQGTINETEAETLLLGLLGVGERFDSCKIPKTAWYQKHRLREVKVGECVRMPKSLKNQQNMHNWIKTGTCNWADFKTKSDSKYLYIIRIS